MKASSYLRSIAFVVIEPKRMGLTVALAAHAAVLLVLLLAPHRSSPELVPISVAIIAQSESLDSYRSAPQTVVASRVIKTMRGPEPSATRSADKHPLGVSKLTRAPVEASHLDEAGHLNELFPYREVGIQPELISSSAPAPRPGMSDVVKQQHPEPPGLTVTKRADWQDQPVEYKELKYSAPGGAVRLSVREASSGGLLGTNLASFGLASTDWPTNTMAKSQKVDWTIVDLKSFGVTVFGYQNEVGSDFKPFGETKQEFAAAGTRTMKAGGQVRLGAFSFGYAHSCTTKTVGSNANFFTAPDSNANFFAAQDANANSCAAGNEASVALALPQLLPGLEGSVSNLLPNLWATVSDKQTLPTGSETAAVANDTVSTSFGGTWNWNDTYATLGYWNYSSGKNPGLGATWSGRGFDANLGMYRSSFGIYVGLSYGQSEDAAVSWQSAGALYNSYVTVSYNPDKLPAISVTAAAGNYNYNAIAYNVTSSDLYANLYADSSRGTYSSLAVGLDLTNWLWSNQTSRALTGPYPSVKLLYRYTENAFSNNSAQTAKDPNSLVAMMVQGKF